MSLLTKTHEKIILLALSTFIGAFLLWLAGISPGIEGGMDSYNHYLISKNSWQHLHLFLDYWGKPIYNLLASPFAQFGIYGMVIFNVLCLIGSAYLVYGIASSLKIKYSWLAFIITLLSPIFLDNTISSLTEPLCAFLVTLTLYLLVKQRFIGGAVVAGLLPFARSEGFIIFGVVLLFFILKKANWKIFISLFAASIFFNLLGWIFTGEPFWIITQNPYINFELSGRNVCGHGSLFHYLWAGHYTFGLVTCILLVIGSGIFLFKEFKNIKKRNLEMWLIGASFVLYFAAHVFIWWKGMMGSCGYVRVMTVIAPLASIIALYGINYLTSSLEKRVSKYSKLLTFGILIFIVLNAFYVPIRYYKYKYPLQISAEQEQYVKLAKWYNTQAFEERTKLYLYPYFSIIADIDPYNQKEHLELWKSSLQYTKTGDIIIWDSHFGPNECNLPLDTLSSNPHWKEIHSIIPSQPIETINRANFEIHVFEKTE